MKKKILGLSVLVGSAMLVGCIDPSSDNSALLQNSLIIEEGQTLSTVGIRQEDIPGFENNSGQNPTQVTVTYSGGAAAARDQGCQIRDAMGANITTGLTATTESNNTGSGDGYSELGSLNCPISPIGTYTADITISFTADGKSYTATTTLTAVRR